MTKKSNSNRREQAPKPVRSRSIETMEFMLQGRGGTHKSAKAYSRKPKHKGKGWDD